MANEDFYVSFGSNLREGKGGGFIANLRTDVGVVKGLIDDLKNSVKQGETAAAQGLRLGLLAPGGTGGGGGGGEIPGLDKKTIRNVNAGLEQMVGHIDDVLGRVTAELQGAAKGTNQVTAQMLAAAKLMRQGAAARNKSEARIMAILEGKGPQRNTGREGGTSKSGKERKAGQFGPAGEDVQLDPAKRKGKNKPGQSIFDDAPKNIAAVPAAMIDEAQINRLVDATKQVSKNTQGTNTRLDRLIAVVNEKGIKVSSERPRGAGATNEDRSDGGGRRKRGTAPKAEVKSAAAPIDDDPFARVSQIRGQIQKQERLAELRKAQKRLAAGQQAHGGDADAAKRLDLRQFGRDNDFRGPKVEKRVTNAIRSLEGELKGVPALKGLKRELDDAIAATGTPDGRRPRDENGRLIGDAPPRKERKRAERRRQAAETADPVAATPSPEEQQASLKQRVKDLKAKRKELRGSIGQAGFAEAMFEELVSQAQEEEAAGKKRKKGKSSSADLQKDLEAARKERLDAEQELAKVERSLAKAQLKAAGVTREEERAVNQRVAKAKKRVGGLPAGVEARNTLARMDIAGDKSALDTLNRDQLMGLTETYRAQGIDVPGVGVRNAKGQLPRTKKADMVNALNDANARWNAGEVATTTGIENYRRGKSEKISGAARKAAKRMMDLMAETIDEAANSVIAADYAAGGTGRGKGKRGKVDNAYGNNIRPNDPDARSREIRKGAGNRDKAAVDYAFDYAGQGGMRDKELERAGRREAARAIKKDPNFNPFASEYDVSGNSDAAKATRQAIAKIRKGSEAFDALGRSIMKYHERIQDIDARTARLAQIQDRLAALAQKETLTPKQTREYTGLLADEKRLKAGAAADAAERKAVEKQLRAGYREGKKTFGTDFTYGAFAPENFKAGYDTRRGARKLREQELEEARLARADPSLLKMDDRFAGREQRFGARNSLGVGAGTVKGQGGKSGTVKRTSFDSLLPNIFNEQQISDQFPKYDRKALKRAQKEANALERAEQELLQLRQDNKLARAAGAKEPHNKHAIASRESEIAQRFSNLLTKIEQATGRKIPTAVSAEEAAKTGALRTYTSLDALAAVKAADKKAADERKANNARLKAEAASGGNLEDPARLLRKNKKGVTELERQAVRSQDSGMESALLKSQQSLAQFDRAITKARRGAEKVGKTFDEQKFAEAYVNRGLLKGDDAGGLAGLAAAAGNSKASAAFSRAAELQQRSNVIGEMDKSSLKKSRVKELEAEQANLMQQARVQGAAGLGAMSKSDLRKGRDLIGQEQIERAREVLARSGVRFSDTINTTLSKAKNLPQLLKALADAIKNGTLQISQYLGPEQVARDAKGRNAYMVGATTGSAISPDSRGAYTRDGQPVVLGPDARRSAETFAADARKKAVGGGTMINPADVGTAAKKASAEPKVLGAYEEVFGPKGAAAKRKAKADAITTSAALDKALDRAQKVVDKGKDAAPVSINTSRGQLAKAMGVDQADFREGGVAGLQRLIDMAKSQGATGRAAEDANTAKANKEVKAATKEAKSKGFDDDCCTKIVEALNRIDKRLQGTITVKGTVKASTRDGAATGGKASKASEDAATDQANTVAAIKRRYAPLDAQALAAYETKITPVMTQVAGGYQRGAFAKGADGLANDKTVQLGTALVTQGYGDRAKVVDFLRQKLNLTAEAAANLDARLKSSIKSQGLVDAAERGDKKSKRRSVVEDEEARRDAKRASTKQEKKDQEARALADAMGKVNAAFDMLTPKSRKLLQDLKDMKAAGADAAKIVAGQKAFYESAARDMAAARPTESTATRKANIGALMSSEYGMGVKVNQQELSRVGKEAEEGIRKSMLASASGNQEAASPLLEALFGGKGFASRVVGSIGTFLVRNFSAGLVFGVTNALQDMIGQALDTEATFVRVSSALEATGRQTGSLRTELQKISTDYGVALKDVYTTASGLTGVFSDNADLAAATRVAAQLESISRGALNSTEAMKALASVTTAFGLSSVEDLSHIADVLTVIQDRLGVNIEDTVEGVGRLAGQAKMLGLSFEETAVYVGAISKLTNQSGQAAGEQFSRILSQLQTGRGQAALMKNLGPDSGIGEALGTRDYASSLEILMDNYDGLNQAQKDNIAVTLGGQRQAAAINALLEQGAKVRDTVRAAEDARGDADERAAAIANTLNNQIKRLQQNFVNLSAAIVRSGVLNFFGALLVSVNATLGVFNTFLSTLNDIADSNPLTRFAKDSMGFLLGLLITVKLLGAGLRALKGVLAASGLQAGTQVPPTAGAPIPPGTGTILPGGRAAEQAAQRSLLARMNPFSGFGAATAPGMAGVNLLPGTGAPERRQTFVTRGFDRINDRMSQLGAALQNSGQGLQQTRNMDPGSRGARAASFLRNDLGRSMERLGTVANGAGGMFGKLSERMQQSAKAAALGSAAVGALTIALTAMIFEGFKASQFSKDQEQAFKDKTDGKTDAEEEEEKRYAGRQAELVEENADSLEGMGGRFRALARGAQNTLLTGGVANLASWGQVIGVPGAGALEGLLGKIPGVKTSAEAVGDFTDVDIALSGKGGKKGNLDQALFKQMQTSFQRIRENGALKDMEALDAASKLTGAEISQLRDDIQNSEMSSEQKASAQAYLDSIEESVNKSAAKTRLKIKGLNSLDLLLASQIETLAGLTNTLTSAGASGGEFTSLISQMSGEVGAQAGSNYERILNELNAPQSGRERTGRLIELERLNLQGLEARLEEEKDPERREELIKTAQASLSRYESLQVSALAQAIDGATAIANELRANGDVEGAARSLQDALTALDGEIERQRAAGDDEAVAAALARKRAVLGTITDTLLEPTLIEEQESRSVNRNRVTNAGSEVREAKAVLDAYEAEGSGKTAMEISGARQRYNNALKAEADALLGARTAELQLQIAQTLNALTRATLEEAAALEAVTSAREKFGEGSEELFSAQARYAASQEARYQAGEAERVAGVETGILRIAPDDTEAVAQARVNAALEAQSQAARYGTTSTQYQTATQQLIQAQRAKAEATREILAADSELEIAILEAAGDRVGVAQKQRAEAERLYQVALEKAGGNTNAASVKRADAARIRAGANERDVIFNDAVATIDFQKEIGEISANTAISLLQELLRQTNLTEEQRRQLRLKIKGLQDDIKGQLTASGFNIPDQIKLPTAYEVRRSLGIDPYVQAGTATLKDLQAMSAQGQMGAMTMSSAPSGPTSTTTVVNNTNTPVTVNNTVSTPAMVEAVARRVVELISTQTNMGARANQTSPALVRY